MRVLWLAPLVQAPGLAGGLKRYAPAIYSYRESALGSFPCTWLVSSTTGRTFDGVGAPIIYAVGEADVDAAQLAALVADPDLVVVAEADYTRPMSAAPPAGRAVMRAFMRRAGLVAEADDETIEGIVERISRQMGHGVGLGDIRRRLDVEAAIYSKRRIRGVI